ncbi:D-alanyl-D-alanine carboxypeptidase/D-alanyl-D-alanine endopeptidase [Histidinibacterium aquaticum]|uniref:D-alanyl-D-alanine carboxypeptidase/D-alanyl-D-alanine-endopeptidase n=1 Tax=Histidinibacterium aquaticum TaxID=2613962 RepID=A0A5J5GKV7_9RHOB|nr:D-alanyl-D-alanine carboxypeptidase/D-alanyl-D-alanine-endopeptidase [Histidinibacterium aquaticum]KAA9008184.1 D-alanyl-D-alanine carboxypeptidase/D-alanyl-D-alanine-endopeptidase [Histidinibacterium aquaticum]
MQHRLTRRAALGAIAAALGSTALAAPPTVSLRPRARPLDTGTDPSAVPPETRATLDELIAEAGLAGVVGLALADVATGQVIEERSGSEGRPPASVAKALTALYALETVGPRHRYATRVLAIGTITDGRLDGDLALCGTGDPTFQTDDAFALAEAVKEAGIVEVTGRFLVWAGALPYEDEIAPDQLDHLAYNPSVSGLNLNFNRVHFQWTRSGSSYDVTLDARSGRHQPEVAMARMEVVDRPRPVYTYASVDEVDHWSVARRYLGDGGARWLPVRRPALYCGDVFRTFARSHGIILPEPERAAVEPTGEEIARHDSGDLEGIITDMLRYSTNLTAEVVGLTATRETSGLPDSIPGSAAAMNDWLAETHGVESGLVDHSGLGDDSRISALQMVKMLTGEGVMDRLKPVMKDHVLKDDAGAPIQGYPAEVTAKTGTLNFVSALAGYIRTAEGADLAFAIFCADLDLRAEAIESGDEIPDGARWWNGRAKGLQQKLLQRWGLIYSG